MVSRLNPDSPEFKQRSSPTIFDFWTDAPSECMGVKAPTSRWLVSLCSSLGFLIPVPFH